MNPSCSIGEALRKCNRESSALRIEFAYERECHGPLSPLMVVSEDALARFPYGAWFRESELRWRRSTYVPPEGRRGNYLSLDQLREELTIEDVCEKHRDLDLIRQLDLAQVTKARELGL